MTKEEMKNILRVYLEAFENYQITNTGNLDATGHIAELARAAVKEDENSSMTDRELLEMAFKAMDCVNDFSSGMGLYKGCFDLETEILRIRLERPWDKARMKRLVNLFNKN
jgi:hypothetical protein